MSFKAVVVRNSIIESILMCSNQVNWDMMIPRILGVCPINKIEATVVGPLY